MCFRSTLSFSARLTVMFSVILLGWGLDDLRGFFAHPARAGLLAVTMVNAGAALVFCSDAQPFRKGKQCVANWVLGLWIVFVLILACFLPFGDRRGLLVFARPDALRYVGLGLYAAGGAIRLVALQTLGKRFSGYVTLQENHQLVQTGIYRLIRHPMYLGILLVMPGAALVFRSRLAVPAFVLSAVFALARIRQEEKLLGDHFGAEFDAYRRRTWRLLPYLY